MGLSFHCPQCSQAVPALPTQMGQQVTCPGCQAQFRLSPILLGGNGQSRPPPMVAPPMATTAAPAAPPVASVVKAPPRAAAPASASAAIRPPAPQTVQPPPVARASSETVGPSAAAARLLTRQPAANVARFIAAASQDSTVQLTADGKLPELSLAEATAKKTKSNESNTSPLVLGLVLSISTLASILLLFVEFDGAAPHETSVMEARARIAEYYVSQSGTLLPYQKLLKEAQLANSLRDYERERECYQGVLALLRSESKDPYAGVTGTLSGDEELMNLLSALLDAGGRER